MDLKEAMMERLAQKQNANKSGIKKVKGAKVDKTNASKTFKGPKTSANVSFRSNGRGS